MTRNLTSEFVTQLHSSFSLKLHSTFKKILKFLLTRHFLIFTRVKLEFSARSMFVACRWYFGDFWGFHNQLFKNHVILAFFELQKNPEITENMPISGATIHLLNFTQLHSSISLELHLTLTKILIFSLTRHSNFTRFLFLKLHSTLSLHSKPVKNHDTRHSEIHSKMSEKTHSSDSCV